MNFKTTALLIVVLLVLCGLYILAPRGGQTQTVETPKPVGPRFVLHDDDATSEFTRVVFERAGQDAIGLERGADGEWRLTAPVAAAADRHQVEELIRVFWGLQSRGVMDPSAPGAVSAADAGLAPPLGVVRLTAVDGATCELAIGQPTELGDDTYVSARDRNEIHIADRDLASQLKRDWREFRSRAVFRFPLADATGLSVRYGDIAYDLERDGQVWRIVAPIDSLADGERVNDALLALTALEAVGFADEQPEAPIYGLDAPSLTATVTLGDATRTLIVGKPADLDGALRYARITDQPSVFMLATNDLNAGCPTFSTLRDRRLIGGVAADVVGVEFVSERTVAIQRDAEDVWRGDDWLKSVNQQAMWDLATTLAELNAITFIDAPEELSAYGLDEPRAVVSVRSRLFEAPLRLELGDPTPDKRSAYLRLVERDAVCTIGKSAAEALAAPPYLLRSLQVFDLEPEQIDLLEIRGFDGEVVRRLTLTADAGWRFDVPANAPLDMGALYTLLADVASLQGLKVVGEDADETFGLTAPTLRIRLSGATPTPFEHELLVGFKAGKAYVRRADDTFVFELEPTVRESLTAEIIDTQLFDFAAADVIEWNVEGEEFSTHLLKENGRWGAPDAPTVALRQDEVARTLEKLAALRVESYTTYDNADLEGLAERAAAHGATATFTLDSGTTVTLLLAPSELPGLVEGGWIENARAFLLRRDDAAVLLARLGTLVEVEADALSK